MKKLFAKIAHLHEFRFAFTKLFILNFNTIYICYVPMWRLGDPLKMALRNFTRKSWSELIFCVNQLHHTQVLGLIVKIVELFL